MFVVVFLKIVFFQKTILYCIAGPKIIFFHRHSRFSCQLSRVNTHFSVFEKTKSPCYGDPKSSKNPLQYVFSQEVFFHEFWCFVGATSCLHFSKTHKIMARDRVVKALCTIIHMNMSQFAGAAPSYDLGSNLKSTHLGGGFIHTRIGPPLLVFHM